MDLKEKLISNYIDRSKVSSRINEIRKKALDNFEAKGFPTKKLEAWKYTSLRPVLREDYSLFPSGKTLTEAEIKEFIIDQLDSYLLVFIDGVFVEKLSHTTEDTIKVISLADAFNSDKYKSLIDAHYNTAVPKGDSLSSMNTAFSNEGSFVYVEKNTLGDKPIQLLYLSTGTEKAMLLQPRNLVIVEENAQVQIIERHQSRGNNPTLTNSVTEIIADQRAIVDYYKIQNDIKSASLIDNTFVSQKDDTDCSIHTFSIGGKLTRNNFVSTLNGEHCNVTFKGVTVINEKQHVDHNTLVHHRQPNCESHQDYKGVFDDKSTGVFDGYILVDKIAQKTDGYQKSDNLLLSDRATAHAKPQLEIYADDVKCSHGCTVGQMDKEALFYLKTRGIPEKEARALMMFAFANSVLETVKIPQLKNRIEKQLAGKLGVKTGLDLATDE